MLIVWRRAVKAAYPAPDQVGKPEISKALPPENFGRMVPEEICDRAEISRPPSAGLPLALVWQNGKSRNMRFAFVAMRV
jgi:hypothetical protein